MVILGLSKIGTGSSNTVTYWIICPQILYTVTYWIICPQIVHTVKDWIICPQILYTRSEIGSWVLKYYIHGQRLDHGSSNIIYTVKDWIMCPQILYTVIY